jgi:hypothetical protein
MIMIRHRFALAFAAAFLLLAPGAAFAASSPIVIEFQKDCPEFTCWETAASPVAVEATITSGWLSGSVFHYTSNETLSSAEGSVTIDFVGVLILDRSPNLTVLSGTVRSGSWSGVDLSGARVHATAIRLFDTTFGGSVQIMPMTAD